MRFTGIEFRRGNGDPLRLHDRPRAHGDLSVCFGTFVLQLISCATILGTRYRQSIADIILGTTAINRPAD